MKKIFLILLTAVIVCLQGCSGKRTQRAGTLLTITDKDGYTIVEIADPWHSEQMLHRYVLVPKGRPLPQSLPEATVIRTPLENVLVFSDIYSRPIAELGDAGSIKSVVDAQYFKTEAVVAGLNNGTIVDCGQSTSPSVEKIISAKPEAIILSPMENAGYGALERMNIPLIEMADYMESNPLQRAAWIEFLGLLYGKRDEAVAVYNKVKDEYTNLKAIAAKAKKKPMVVSEYVINGVWYVPGGKSYKASLFADAGALYPWADNDKTGSLPLDFSLVISKAQAADFWLVNVYGFELTKERMLGLYPHNNQMKAFDTGGVYYVNSATTGIFEETAFHPERLLREYVKIFHPELLPDYSLRYYKQMK